MRYSGKYLKFIASRPERHDPEFNRYVFWFRLFSYGVHLSWIMPGYSHMLISISGCTKTLKLGRLWIKGLKP